MRPEDALDAHLKRWEQDKPEMVEVEKSYFDWLEAEHSSEFRPLVKVSDGDVWLIFPDAMVSIEGICKLGVPGEIVKRNLRKWRDGVLKAGDDDE